MLQTLVGTRSSEAAFRIAHDMVGEGLVDLDEALGRVTGAQLVRLMFPRFDDAATRVLLTVGVSASPGAAVGRVVLDAETAVQWSERGEDVILVREETNPLPVPWYAGEELHLAEVVDELPDVDSFVAFGDGAAVRLEDGEVIEVDGGGDVSALADPPQDLLFPPSLPDYLPFGRYTYVVQGTVLPDGGRAFVLDSRRGDRNNSLQIPTSSHRVLVLCEPNGSCREAEGGIPAEGFRLR